MIVHPRARALCLLYHPVISPCSALFDSVLFYSTLPSRTASSYNTTHCIAVLFPHRTCVVGLGVGRGRRRSNPRACATSHPIPPPAPAQVVWSNRNVKLSQWRTLCRLAFCTCTASKLSIVNLKQKQEARSVKIRISIPIPIPIPITSPLRDLRWWFA